MQMEKTTAIFDSTGQALHVAFQIMAQPAMQDSMTRKSLLRLMDAMTFLPDQVHDWLLQLRGTPSDTVHFEGLSSYDVRAQCALILSAVRSKLPPPEMWSIQAKYAAMDEVGEGASKHCRLSAEKAEAIRALSRWLVQTSAFHGVSMAATNCMVAKFYVHHKKTQDKLSFRELAKEFGGDHLVYWRAYRKMRELLRPLEIMAIARLEPYFIAQGIVADHRAEAA